MAEKKSQSVRNNPVETKPDEEPLGAYLTAAREKRGVSRQDLSREAHIPLHYVGMIETDDYALLADQLYMLPFLRRYAAFVGLDAEEVASRFVRDVQRADVIALRMSEPIPMSDGKRSSLRPAAITIALGAIVVGAVFVGWHVLASRFMHPGGVAHEPVVAESPAEVASPANGAAQPASSPAAVAPAAVVSEVIAVPAAAASQAPPSADDSGSRAQAGQRRSRPEGSASPAPRKPVRPTTPPANVDPEGR